MKIIFSFHCIPYRNNQCCRSGMFIPGPRWGILIFSIPGSQIPDLRSRFNNNRKEEGGKSFFCIHKFDQIIKYFLFKIKQVPFRKNVSQ